MSTLKPSEPPAPSGTITLVFTDIQGSTQLWEKLGNDFRPLLDQHNRIIREAIAHHQGYEVKTEGDAFMIAFPTSRLALCACIEAQQALHEADWPELLEEGDLYTVCGRNKDGSFAGLRVRMGIHHWCQRSHHHPRQDIRRWVPCCYPTL